MKEIIYQRNYRKDHPLYWLQIVSEDGRLRVFSGALDDLQPMFPAQTIEAREKFFFDKSAEGWSDTLEN